MFLSEIKSILNIEGYNYIILDDNFNCDLIFSD